MTLTTYVKLIIIYQRFSTNFDKNFVRSLLLHLLYLQDKLFSKEKQHTNILA